MVSSACVLRVRCGFFSSSTIIYSQPKIACSILDITVWKSGCPFCSPEGEDITVASEEFTVKPPERGEKTALLTVLLLSEFLNIDGNGVNDQTTSTITRKDMFLTQPSDTFLSFPVIQEERRWLLNLQRSPASEPGGGWRY